MIAARRSSPLVIGLGNNEYFIASDATPIVEYTDRVIYLNNDDIALIRRDELVLKNLTSDSTKVNIQTLDLGISEIEKQGFDHFMLKEIFEQPRSIQDTFRGRISPDTNEIRLGRASYSEGQTGKCETYCSDCMWYLLACGPGR